MLHHSRPQAFAWQRWLLRWQVQAAVTFLWRWCSTKGRCCDVLRFQWSHNRVWWIGRFGTSRQRVLQSRRSWLCHQYRSRPPVEVAMSTALAEMCMYSVEIRKRCPSASWPRSHPQCFNSLWSSTGMHTSAIWLPCNWLKSRGCVRRRSASSLGKALNDQFVWPRQRCLMRAQCACTHQILRQFKCSQQQRSILATVSSSTS
mmetsp:Transcript_4757/g.10915  ORF Transcript_4757/g.10915 Transcript_4757/m.10915 type:complete len:202 (+) Transcript_4757:143-748(+)